MLTDAYDILKTHLSWINIKYFQASYYQTTLVNFVASNWLKVLKAFLVNLIHLGNLSVHFGYVFIYKFWCVLKYFVEFFIFCLDPILVYIYLVLSMVNIIILLSSLSPSLFWCFQTQWTKQRSFTSPRSPPTPSTPLPPPSSIHVLPVKPWSMTSPQSWLQPQLQSLFCLWLSRLIRIPLYLKVIFPFLDSRFSHFYFYVIYG